MPFFAGFFSDSLKKHAYYCLAFGHLHLSLLPAITFSHSCQCWTIVRPFGNAVVAHRRRGRP